LVLHSKRRAYAHRTRCLVVRSRSTSKNAVEEGASSAKEVHRLWPRKPRRAMRRRGLVAQGESHHYVARFASAKNTPAKLRRHFSERYTLFSRFDMGITLDDEMWYSVTPEPIAYAQAVRVAARSEKRGGVLVDGFCGAGGNSIQFPRAAQNHFVVGLDIHAERLQAVRRHADIYGTSLGVDVVKANFLSASRLFRTGVVDGVFLSPPWADKGIVPKHGSFSVRQLAHGLNGAVVLQVALAIAPDVAFFLPRSTRWREIRAMAVQAGSDVKVQNHIRWVNGREASHPTALTCYFGRWA